MKLGILAVLAASLAAAGCATTEADSSAPKAAARLPHEVEAPTGSNMRRRTPLESQGGEVKTMSREELERNQARPATGVPR
jgi:hypothetical protein